MASAWSCGWLGFRGFLSARPTPCCRWVTSSTLDLPIGVERLHRLHSGLSASPSSWWAWCWWPAPEVLAVSARGKQMVKKMLPFTRPTIDEETIQGVAEVLRSGWLASGPKVAEFEAALSRYLGGRPVRTQTSATASMEMALLACGIGADDEVIAPAMSFVATANVIMRVRARPVFVDVGLDSRNIDLEQVKAAITPRTRAIMPVHFSGLPVNMDRLHDIAARHGLRVIEDAAHAIGSFWEGRRIGSFGDLVCFSFHPNKNMTTIEGGAVSGGSPDEVKALELHRWHGQLKSPSGVDTVFAGGKANLSDVAARGGLGEISPPGGIHSA